MYWQRGQIKDPTVEVEGTGEQRCGWVRVQVHFIFIYQGLSLTNTIVPVHQVVVNISLKVGQGPDPYHQVPHPCLDFQYLRTDKQDKVN